MNSIKLLKYPLAKQFSSVPSAWVAIVFPTLKNLLICRLRRPERGAWQTTGSTQ
jgi:hypothetical protein